MNYTIRPERKEDYREVENHVETVVYLSNINPRPRTHIEIGVDAEDYYNIGEGCCPSCPPEKEDAIKDALRHFGMISASPHVFSGSHCHGYVWNLVQSFMTIHKSLESIPSFLDGCIVR